MLKQALRKQMLAQRAVYSAQQIAAVSRHIGEVFFQNFDLTNVQYLHIFLPIATKKEIDTWYIIERIWAEYPHTKLAVPVVLNNNGELVHRLLTPDTLLELSAWGIPEPTADSPVLPPNLFEMALVPLLAFDLSGNRVGYGKGFYDRFLAQCKPDIVKVGLSLFEPVERIENTDHLDVKLNFAVCPNKLYTL